MESHLQVRQKCACQWQLSVDLLSMVDVVATEDGEPSTGKATTSRKHSLAVVDVATSVQADDQMFACCPPCSWVHADVLCLHVTISRMIECLFACLAEALLAGPPDQSAEQSESLDQKLPVTASWMLLYKGFCCFGLSSTCHHRSFVPWGIQVKPLYLLSARL